MAKSTGNAGGSQSNRTTSKTMKTPAKTGNKAQQRNAGNKTQQRGAGGKTPQRNAGNKTAQRDAGTTTQQGRQGLVRAPAEGGPGPKAGTTQLSPIGERETAHQMIAAAASDAGIEARTGATFNRLLMTRVQRHIMRGGSGYAPIPGLGAALVLEEQVARKAYTMKSRLTGRTETVPARQAGLVPKLRVHPTLQEIVARA